MQFCSHFAHLHLTPVRCKQLQHARQPVNNLNVGAAANYAGLSACPGFLYLGRHSKIARRCPHCETKILVEHFAGSQGLGRRSSESDEQPYSKLAVSTEPHHFPHFADGPSSTWFAVQ